MAEDLPEYQAFVVNEHDCAVQPCVNRPEFHHPRHLPTIAPWITSLKSLRASPGAAQKCSDWYGIGMCPGHHSDLHRGEGFFANMTKEDIRTWQDKQVARLHASWAMRHPDKMPGFVEPPAKAGKRMRRAKPKDGAGWTVAGVIRFLRSEARHRPAEAAAALSEAADFIAKGKVFQA
jgi:hypothetical protein